MVVFAEEAVERGATQAGQDKGQFSLHKVLLALLAPQTFHSRIIFHVPGFRTEFFPGLRENKVDSIIQHLSRPT